MRSAAARDTYLFSNRFCRHADENKRQKVALILDKLITMTIDEVEVSVLLISYHRDGCFGCKSNL